MLQAKSKYDSELEYLDRISKSLNDWKLSCHGKEKDKAEEFLAKIDDCFKFTGAPNHLLLEAITRVFDGKAGIWFRNNKEDFTSWKKFKKVFEEYYFELLDEDELYDELSRRVQTKEESIDEFVNVFRHLARRLSNPLRKQ